MDLLIIVFRLFLAVVCGAVIGFEREIRDKAAGLRTHILVSLGACLFGVMGVALHYDYTDVDILRLAQGLIIGIGFLGAGVIFREGASIRGLTTAAGIWVLGSIGLCIGVGYYQIGLLGTAFAFLTISVFGRLEKLVKK